MRYAVNCSLLFTELPLLQRPAAAKAAGFDAVEFWWPFEEAVPPRAQVDAFIEAVRDADVRLVALNFFGGDPSLGERGVLCVPGRADEFRANVAVVARIGRALGCAAFNAAYGNRMEGVTAAEQDALAVDQLAHAAGVVGEFGGVVLVEALSGVPDYPLRRAADVIDVLDRVTAQSGVTNLGLLCDLYHLAVNGDDLDAVIGRLAARIAHVQIADAPGRGEPGTGEIPLARLLAALNAQGYDGWVSLECVPSGSTAGALASLPPLPAA